MTLMVRVQLPKGASVTADRDTLPAALVAVALEPEVQLMVRLGEPAVVIAPGATG